MLGLICRYFKGQKCHLYMQPSKENDRHEIVVLVHGLIRRSYNMGYMGKFLRRHGYTIYVYDYKTSVKGMDGHGKDFRDYLRKILKENSPDVPVNIVTHSMGGILTRFALGADERVDALSKPLDIKRFKRIVMLAPPHHGSKMARFFTKYLPFSARWLKPLSELSDAEDSMIHSVPLVPEGPEIGIVAGKYDSEVAYEYTYLEGMKERCTLKSEHSFMVYLAHVHLAVLRFLENGSFKWEEN